MGRVSLTPEYERLKRSPSVRCWFDSLSDSPSTRQGAIYSLYRFTNYSGKDPEAMLADKERELKRERRHRFETEDKLRTFIAQVKGGYVYAAYVKSFFAANHLPLDLRLKRPEPKRESAALPDDEKLKALLAATGNKQLRSLILFLIDSGARIGSVLQLQYGHLKADLEAGTYPARVTFPASITKGGRPYVGFIGEDAGEALRDYLAWRSKDRATKDIHGRRYTLKGRPVSDSSFVFESRNGKALSKTSTIRRIQDAAYQSGLNPSRGGLKAFHPHLLRARAQTVLEGAQVPLNWVDYLLGHTPRGSQASAYSRPTDVQLRDAYAKAYPSLRLFKQPTPSETANAELEEKVRKQEAEIARIREMLPRILEKLG